MKMKLLSGLTAIAFALILMTGCSADDTTSPIITLNGAATITIGNGDTYTELGAIGSDDQDGSVDVTSNYSTTNPDVNAPGVYTITYTAYDKAGNVSTFIRTVIVNWKGSQIASPNYTNIESDSIVGFSVFPDSCQASVTDTSADAFTFYYHPIFQHTITNDIVCNVVNGYGISIPAQYPIGPGSSILVQGVGEGVISKIGTTFLLDFTVKVTQMDTVPNQVVYCKIHSYSN